MRQILLRTLTVAFAASLAIGQGLPADIKGKVEAKAKALQVWSSDPAFVAAVREYNANTPAESKAMTNEKWKTLTVLDPFARSFTKNALAEHIKALRDETISEAFVSGADGGKVAFLSKTTSWTHKGKEKHMTPMTGHTYFGPVEQDESTGQQQVQVGLPVLDAGKPIGSIVIGLSVSKLR